MGTQANRLAAERKFFSWLLNEQQIAYNPASTLQLPKQPQRLPRGVLTKTEARRLIEATPAGHATFATAPFWKRFTPPAFGMRS